MAPSYGIQLRPIVSNRGSACYPLSPLTGKFSLYVKNSAHFVEGISNAPIHSNQMVSLDIVNLFTKVPTNETLAVVWDKMAAETLLKEHTNILIDNLMEILTVQKQSTSGRDQMYTDKRNDWLWVHYFHQYWPIYTRNTSKKWH